MVEVVDQPPLQQFKRQVFSAYCSLELDAQEHGRPEQKARSSVVNVMQGVAQLLGLPEKLEQSEQVCTPCNKM